MWERKYVVRSWHEGQPVGAIYVGIEMPLK